MVGGDRVVECILYISFRLTGFSASRLIDNYHYYCRLNDYVLAITYARTAGRAVIDMWQLIEHNLIRLSMRGERLLPGSKGSRERLKRDNQLEEKQIMVCKVWNSVSNLEIKLVAFNFIVN